MCQADCPGLAHRAGLIPAVLDQLRSAGALLTAALDLVGSRGQVAYADLGGLRELVGALWPPDICPACGADALVLVAVAAAGLIPAADRPDVAALHRRHLSTLAARPT